MLLTGALLAATGFATGCRQTAIRSNDERSQYDRYDAVRNERSQQYLFDAYGRRRPNLRGRLLEN